jgi:uncharacterized protein (TIGR03083 family)
MADSAGWFREVATALQESADSLAALAGAVHDVQRRVPASPAWTIHDAFAHVSTVVPRYAQGPEGQGDWVPDARELSGLNAKQLQALAFVELPVLVETIHASLRDLLRQIQAYGARPPSFHFHGGSRVPADVALGILLGEFLIHGRDIAQAIGYPWTIRPHHAALVIQGVTPILPGWVNPERAGRLTATFDVRLRHAPRSLWSFVNGQLAVNPRPAPRPDVHLISDPAAFLLVMYRRESQWTYILRGRMLAYGRKPWLALSLADRFHRP